MPRQFKREPLTLEEEARLVNACETSLERLIIWTLLDTGLRVSELVSLTPDKIDWQGNRLTIFGKGGIYGSQSKRRVVSLTYRTAPLIQSYFSINDRLEITTARGVQKLIKRVANRAKITKNVTPHILRHTFAVRAVQKSISLPALQRLLGHDRLTTTEIYLNLSPEDVLREFRDKWEKV